jgi:hypothetical protein
VLLGSLLPVGTPPTPPTWKYKTALLGSVAPPASAVDDRHKLDDATPSLRQVSLTSRLLRVAPPLCLASVRSSSWGSHLDFSLRRRVRWPFRAFRRGPQSGSLSLIEATGSHVPHKGLMQVHAAFMPDAAQPSCRPPLDSSRANDSSRFRHHPYAFDTYTAVHSFVSLNRT